ncbi:MAG: Ig domain-containing protein [Pseudomonadota bacterium]
MTLPLDITPFFTGEELSYGATGLPTGLNIDPVTGVISGAPTTEGVNAVNVTATNSAGQAGQSFTWTIAAAQSGGGGITAEAGAAGHWVFGSDHAGLADLVSSQAMSEQIAGATSLTANTVVISDGDGTASQAQRGLVSPIAQQVDQTVCAVVSAASSSHRILLGNLSTTDGAGLFLFGGDLFGNARGLPFNNTNFDSPLPVSSQFVFVAMSISATQNWVLFRGDPANAAVATGAPLASPAPTSVPVGIGNTTYNSASFTEGGQYAEFIVFNSHKTSSELEAVYQRSKLRMSERGIDLL